MQIIIFKRQIVRVLSPFLQRSPLPVRTLITGDNAAKMNCFLKTIFYHTSALCSVTAPAPRGGAFISWASSQNTPKKTPKTLPIKSWIGGRNVGLKMKEENKLQQIVGEQQTRLKMFMSPNRKHDWIVSRLGRGLPSASSLCSSRVQGGGGHKRDNQPWKPLFNSQLDLHLIGDYLVQSSDLLVLENHYKLCHVSSQQHDLKQAAQANREQSKSNCNVCIFRGKMSKLGYRYNQGGLSRLISNKNTH